MKPPLLDSLSTDERAQVLALLLRHHPELAQEMAEIASTLLATEDQDDVAEDVRGQLLALSLDDGAQRAGPQWGGGYVDPREAGDELLDGVLQPYWDDMRRRASAGAAPAATHIAYGVLRALHGCRDVDDDLALTYAGMPDAVDGLAARTLAVAAKARIDLDGDWMAAQRPQWLPRQARAGRAGR